MRGIGHKHEDHKDQEVVWLKLRKWWSWIVPPNWSTMPQSEIGLLKKSRVSNSCLCHCHTNLVKENHGVHWSFGSFVHNEIDDQWFASCAYDYTSATQTDHDDREESMPLNHFDRFTMQFFKGPSEIWSSHLVLGPTRNEVGFLRKSYLKYVFRRTLFVAAFFMNQGSWTLQFDDALTSTYHPHLI